MLERNDQLLLVRQQGPEDPGPSWMLPGGRVEPGESLADALTREVREETGLDPTDLGPLLYAIQVIDKARDRQGLVFTYRVMDWQGELRPADPDGLVQAARFWSRQEAQALIAEHPWPAMRQPLLSQLVGGDAVGSTWIYEWLPDQGHVLRHRLSPPPRPSPPGRRPDLLPR